MKLKLALAAATAILIMSLAANVYFYAEESVAFAAKDSLQGKIADLQSQLAILKNQTRNLQDEIVDLQDELADLINQMETPRREVRDLQNENGRLQSEQASLQTLLSQLSQGRNPARLVTRLGASDMRYNYTGQDIRLYVTGEVWNVGSEPARNTRLHVTLYQGEVVAKDTYIELGTIEGGSWKNVGRNIYYTGDALTNWTIVPEHG